MASVSVRTVVQGFIAPHAQYAWHDSYCCVLALDGRCYYRRLTVDVGARLFSR